MHVVLIECRQQSQQSAHRLRLMNGLWAEFLAAGFQELLMPPFAWLRSDLGTFFLEPSTLRPWTARLRLEIAREVAYAIR